MSNTRLNMCIFWYHLFWIIIIFIASHWFSGLGRLIYQINIFPTYLFFSLQHVQVQADVEWVSPLPCGTHWNQTDVSGGWMWSLCCHGDPRRPLNENYKVTGHQLGMSYLFLHRVGFFHFEEEGIGGGVGGLGIWIYLCRASFPLNGEPHIKEKYFSKDRELRDNFENVEGKLGVNDIIIGDDDILSWGQDFSFWRLFLIGVLFKQY